MKISVTTSSQSLASVLTADQKTDFVNFSGDHGMTITFRNKASDNIYLEVTGEDATTNSFPLETGEVMAFNFHDLSKVNFIGDSAHTDLHILQA